MGLRIMAVLLLMAVFGERAHTKSSDIATLRRTKQYIYSMVADVLEKQCPSISIRVIFHRRTHSECAAGALALLDTARCHVRCDAENWNECVHIRYRVAQNFLVYVHWRDRERETGTKTEKKRKLFILLTGRRCGQNSIGWRRHIINAWSTNAHKLLLISAH